MTEETERQDHYNSQRQVLEKLKILRKEIEQGKIPHPVKDWDLIWVLSGGYLDFEIETGLDGKPNDNRLRLLAGFELAKVVTALRIGKESTEVSLEDIQKHGPKVYFNGADEHNNLLRETVNKGVLEQTADFPRENIIISPNLGITKTVDQFEKFPPELAEKNRKIILVTDPYHIIRCRGIAQNPYNPIPIDKLIMVPSKPFMFPFKPTREEIRNIPAYIKKGWLPPLDRFVPPEDKIIKE